MNDDRLLDSQVAVNESVESIAAVPTNLPTYLPNYLSTYNNNTHPPR